MISRARMLREFGVFRGVFETMGDDTTPYLTLMQLRPDRATPVVEAVRRATARRNSDKHRIRLLSDLNWRPHLVAAVSTRMAPTAAAIDACWTAFDRGSWVSPQLAAALSLVDDSFVPRAVDRLNAGCPVDLSALVALVDPLTRHSFQGPAGSRLREAKAAAALSSLLVDDYPNDSEIATLCGSQRIAELVSADVDNAAEIAVEWRDRLEQLLATATASRRAAENGTKADQP